MGRRGEGVVRERKESWEKRKGRWRRGMGEVQGVGFDNNIVGVKGLHL